MELPHKARGAGRMAHGKSFLLSALHLVPCAMSLLKVFQQLAADRVHIPGPQGHHHITRTQQVL